MFECAITTDSQRKLMLKSMKPSKSDLYSYQNLNLAYGARNVEKDYFLTLAYYLSDCVKRCDEPDDYTYVLLHKGTAYRIYVQSGRGIEGLRVYKGECSFISEDEPIEEIKYYNSIDSFTKLENQCDESLNRKSFMQLNEEYKEILISGEKKKHDKTNMDAKPYASKKKPEMSLAYCIIMGIITGLFAAFSWDILTVPYEKV